VVSEVVLRFMQAALLLGDFYVRYRVMAVFLGGVAGFAEGLVLAISLAAALGPLRES
jgi:hypothetical protein